jgi:hypothetical protein
MLSISMHLYALILQLHTIVHDKKVTFIILKVSLLAKSTPRCSKSQGTLFSTKTLHLSMTARKLDQDTHPHQYFFAGVP